MTRESFPTPVSRRKEQLSEAEEKTFDLLVTEHKKTAIDMDEFKQIPFYAERLERDKASVERKRAVIKKEGTESGKKAQILEAIFAEQIELSDWFGQNIRTIVPTAYDDFFHGIDLTLEADGEQDTEYLALGMDATYSTKTIQDKLMKIKRHIADGTLTMMEYFHSDSRPDFYGIMRNIPQVVMGTEVRMINELSELWITAYGLPKLRREKSDRLSLSPEAEHSQRKAVKDAKKELGRHRVQFLLLEEIKIQLSAFWDFAVKINQTEASSKFSSLLKLIDAVLKEKGVPDREDVFRNRQDAVFQAISEAVKDLF